MSEIVNVRYYGWSNLSIETDAGLLFFDPFYRRYCGAQWYEASDFTAARYVCVTHGHEEHFLDVPEVARTSGATVIGSPSLCRFLKRRHHLDDARLEPIDPATFETVDLPGFSITALPWEHRDINLWKALSKAVFKGNATQLKWAWSSATSAPFYSPYTGFHVALPSGVTLLNYNEGFNSKMTDAQLDELRRRFRVDILLAGMQLDFVDDVARGVEALAPRVLILYPPHEKFHEMMGVTSRPWTDFRDAVKRRSPDVDVRIAAPGFEFRMPA